MLELSKKFGKDIIETRDVIRFLEVRPISCLLLTTADYKVLTSFSRKLITKYTPPSLDR